jgi:hypothetical protein
MSDPSSPVQSNRLKTWYKKVTTLPDEFNPNVSFWEAVFSPYESHKGSCFTYSFPLLVLNIMCLVALISIFYFAVHSFFEGYIVTGVVILFGGLVFNLFTFYTNAYLIKGCQCAKINSEKIVRQNAVKDLNINTNP